MTIIVSKDSEGIVKVEHIDAFLGVPLDRQTGYVLDLHRTWHFRAIVSEYSGLGLGPTDELMGKLGRGIIVDFRPTAENKAKGYDSLKYLMERGHLELPKHPRLQSELRGLGFKLTELGTRTIHGQPDDHADGIMLACWPFRTTSFTPAVWGVELGQGRLASRALPEKRSIIEEYFPLDAGRREPVCAACQQAVDFPRAIRGESTTMPAACEWIYPHACRRWRNQRKVNKYPLTH